jgi:zinc protease
MKIILTSVILASTLAAGASPTLAKLGGPGSTLDISFKKFVLKNGLTLIVHEDHKAPIVAVNVWYHVGSKNERPGKTGFAHLFEHLMFNGSEHFDDDYFKATEQVGASELNGTTSEDRTNYFEDAPKEALDYLLWLESDRMGHLLGAVSQAKLDEQRGVVQNEKRQGENRPYAIADELINKATYPAGHPYSWTVIGSMEDLNAASLDDVKDWFRKYYGAANATLVVAGDINSEEVLQKVQNYFRDIPAGPPLTRYEAWIVKRAGEQRQVAQDRVPQPRLYKVWNVPQFGSPEADYLSLVSEILASGKSSRFYKRLVYDEQIASDVSAYLDAREIGGHFVIVATARPGVPVSKVEKALNEELARFLANGPTADELERVKTQTQAEFIRGLERIGGFGGKSDVLAMNQVFLGRPDAWKESLERVSHAATADLRDTARRWLSDGVYVLEIRPLPEFQITASDVDRSKLPVPTIQLKVGFPKLERATLSNGLKVVLAERHSVPLVELALLADAGYASDQSAQPGTAKLAMNMVLQGTRFRNALQISDELDRLGATLSTGSDLDSSFVSMSALKQKLNPSLELLADVIENPTFPEADFQRMQNLQLDDIRREKADPNNIALRVLPGLLYGPNHPYSTPFTGSGTEASVARITRADAVRFHDTWFKPNNATLVVVGDTTMAEMKPRLDQLFANWKPGAVPAKNITRVNPPEKPLVYLIDRPGSVQSAIFVGELAPPKANPQETAIEVMNDILGGTFTSRLNMNLREDKHWSYGVRSSLVDARGPRPFFVAAPVQTDKTKEAMAEILKELQGITTSKPASANEVAKIQKERTLKLAGAWESNGAVAASISRMVRFDLPPDYYDTYAVRVLALKQRDVDAAARSMVHTDRRVWVIVGDRAKIEADIRALGLGEVRLMNADGDCPGSSTGRIAVETPPAHPPRVAAAHSGRRT